jgi:hypothetical protein
MPNLTDIQNLISTLGFPIFMSLYFMYAQQKAAARHDRVLEELNCVQKALQETKLQVGQVLPAADQHYQSIQEQKEGNQL